MNTLYICRGLPASGKTTWAIEQVLIARQPVVRVNRDELRQMAHANRFDSVRELMTVRFRDACIAQALSLGYTVISDDTNLRNHTVEGLITLASVHHAAVHFVEFPVPVSVCIERDSRRLKPVGQEVIETMAKSQELLSERMRLYPTMVAGGIEY